MPSSSILIHLFGSTFYSFAFISGIYLTANHLINLQLAVTLTCVVCYSFLHVLPLLRSHLVFFPIHLLVCFCYHLFLPSSLILLSLFSLVLILLFPSLIHQLPSFILILPYHCVTLSYLPKLPTIPVASPN